MKSSLKIIKSVNAMAVFSRKVKRSGKTIGLVPTMGYLHEGHLSLVKAAKKSCDVVIVSIFVNPIQFGPREDLKNYPRNLKKDLKLLNDLHVDAVFVPSAKEMFPPDFSAFVEVPSLGRMLCGGARPIHFRGVATVVAKLFNIVAPDTAYFGRKDHQQFIIIKRMAKDLNMPVKVVGLPTVREKDGLAMSSRNSYLGPDERKAAASLFRALQLAKKMIGGGARGRSEIVGAMSRLISSARPRIAIEYIDIRDPETLERKDRARGRTLIALAAHVGRTRLIDNIIVGE